MENNQNLLNKIDYLKELSKMFPTRDDAATEIINLNSILALPRGAEHFMSDLHGQADAFTHILNNASGGIKFRIKQLYSNTLSEEQRDELATLIYYPKEKMDIILPDIENKNEWYETNLLRIIEVTKRFSSRYTKSKVRKLFDPNLSYILDELLYNDMESYNKENYYRTIIKSIIDLGYAEKLIISLSSVTKKLAVDELHIIGDVYDRGPEPQEIMNLLDNYHSVDIEWGNHDILWLGASLGSDICVSGVLTNSVRHNNLDIVEDTYGINLRPLANFAEKTYEEAKVWKPRKTTDKDYDNDLEIRQAAKIHKAISVIMYKLEGTFAKEHPEYHMTHRCLLENIDYENSSITIDGKVYHLEDSDFPTIDRNDPYKLTSEEEKIINDLTKAFLNSESLQRHMNIFITKGSMYKIVNNNLLYHALVPLNEDGTLKQVDLGKTKLSGRRLFDYIDAEVRKLFYSRGNNNKNDLDLMWYLWCGPDSPFFGKDKMTTLERVLIKDKSSHKETRNYYYKYQEDRQIIESIMKDFNIESLKDAHIINGHIPVEKINGENPLKAENKLIVIDGGFSKEYQKTTGIAGYTLISGSTGMRLIAHEPFTSKDSAIKNNEDIHSSIDVEQNTTERITNRQTDKGKELLKQISNLKDLISAYEMGLISENKDYIYVKVLRTK